MVLLMINRLAFVLVRIFLVAILLICPSSPLEAKQSHQLLFDQALKESKEGNYSAALEIWTQLLESFPNDALAWSNQGNVRFALGDVEGAIADQTKSIQILPTEVDSHLNRGIAEEALKLWDAAENDYSWILQHEPDNPYALYNLGNVQVAQKNWIEAKALFGKVFLADSGFILARSSHALSTYQLGKFDDAESELRLIIRKYPMFADARAALSALLWRKGFFGEAESHWAAASGLDNRYGNQNWLLNVRRWPPLPIQDLLAFLDLENP